MPATPPDRPPHGPPGLAWLRAGLPGVAEAAELLATSDDLDLLLATTCRVARAVTGARYAALGVVGDDQRLTRFVHDGLADGVADEIGPLPTGDGVLGVLVRDPRTLRLHDVRTHPASSGFPPGHPPMRTFLGTPVRALGEVFGNLYLTDKDGGFDADDEQVVTVLAGQAGAAVASLRLRGELEALALQDERDRIGRDLHDHATQRLFATVMLLDTLAERVAPDDRELLEHAAGQVQGVIADLRRLTHDLHDDGSEPASLREVLVEAARDHEAATGRRPCVEVDDALDGMRLTARLVDDLAAIAGEALSNVARHAGADRVELLADVADGLLVLQVRDDGKGVPSDMERLGRGLDNIRSRATGHQGRFTLASEEGVGTTVQVEVPVPAEDDRRSTP